ERLDGQLRRLSLAARNWRIPNPDRITALCATEGILRMDHERRMAEGEGFEPPARFPVQWFSRPPPSTNPPPLRGGLAPFYSETSTASATAGLECASPVRVLSVSASDARTSVIIFASVGRPPTYETRRSVARSRSSSSVTL